MPIVNSSYTAPFLLTNSHVQSIAPTLFRRVDIEYQREILELEDGDFLDLDWLGKDSSQLLILSHGLEGSSNSSYVKGMAKFFSNNNWDVLAWNFRGCGGSLNRLPRFYHSGSSDDLESVINYALSLGRYKQIALVGFSMGGNQTLLYLCRHEVPYEVKCAVAFSVPCDLTSCADELAKTTNKIYMNRFISDLERKVKYKAKQFPDLINTSNFNKIKSFHDFDELYTAPLHGFKDRFDYWETCSSGKYLKSLKRPALLVSAQDDPFLSEKCFPINIAESSEKLFFEHPTHGGHVGFIRTQINKVLWSEIRAQNFINSVTGTR